MALRVSILGGRASMIVRFSGINHAAIVLATVLAASNLPVYAQSSSDTQSTSDLKSNTTWQDNGLEEIIVTANKREESIDKVGLTIQALGGDEIRQQQINSPLDLAAAVPGLSYSQTEANTPVYTLRGIGFYDTSFAAFPAVTVYMDQAPLPLPVET